MGAVLLQILQRNRSQGWFCCLRCNAVRAQHYMQLTADHLGMPVQRVCNYKDKVQHWTIRGTSLVLALVQIWLHKHTTSVRKSIVYKWEIAFDEICKRLR